MLPHYFRTSGGCSNQATAGVLNNFGPQLGSLQDQMEFHGAGQTGLMWIRLCLVVFPLTATLGALCTQVQGASLPDGSQGFVGAAIARQSIMDSNCADML